MGALTTHVLDTARGLPAAGMRLALYRTDGGTVLIDRFTTNPDGRCDGPLLEGDEFISGGYRLEFFAGEYFRDTPGVTEPPFLDRIALEFNLTVRGGHYHVPLLVSPWSYSTYRGS